jgi:Gamma-glutamyl cyclotransferase, AIG2-like
LVMADRPQYLFAYGSLLGRGDGRGGEGPRPEQLQPALLAGYRRTWNVAMDNSQSIPGYKQYLDPATGEPAPGFVVFLNIVADDQRRVNGALMQVSASQLVALDQRERNYERTDVSAALVDAVPGTVWAYLGSSDALARFRAGQRTRTAMIDRAYLEAVRRGFATLGQDTAALFDALTDPPPCPVMALRRVAVPTA